MWCPMHINQKIPLPHKGTDLILKDAEMLCEGRNAKGLRGLKRCSELLHVFIDSSPGDAVLPVRNAYVFHVGMDTVQNKYLTQNT